MSMTLNPGSASDAPMMEMNMTPLIDVLLVLIILMIMTLPVQNHFVDMNFGGVVGPEHVSNVVTIDVDFDGTVSWNKEVISDRHILEAKLKDVFSRGEKPGARQDEVHIHPDKLANYKYVATVLASAKRLGIYNLGIIGNEQFTD